MRPPAAALTAKAIPKVPVDDSLPVGVIEGISHVDGDLDRFFDAELSFAIQLGPECLTLDVGHDVIKERIGLAGVEQRQDVRMLQAGGGSNLLNEPFGAEHRGELGLEHLDRHLAFVLEVFRQVDGGHAAFA